jgi:hypothetical protein
MKSLYYMSDEIGDRLTPELSGAGGPLECEIYSSTNHAKVVVWTIHYIPTKIVYPADMRVRRTSMPPPNCPIASAWEPP